MTVNIRNDELVDMLKADFQPNYSNTFHWESCVSVHLELPGLRAYYPLASVDYAAVQQGGDQAPVSYQLVNNNVATFGYDTAAAPTLPAYCHFQAAASQSLSRADGGAADWMDITGTEAYIIAGCRGLSFGCWCYFDGVAGVVPEPLITKWLTTGNQRSFRLERTAGGNAYVAVSVDGTAVTASTSTATIGATTWTFVAGRFIPSTSLDIWINDSYESVVAGIPASIFDSTADFVLGSDANYTNYLDGRMAHAWVCASALSDGHIWGLFQRTRALYGI